MVNKNGRLITNAILCLSLLLVSNQTISQDNFQLQHTGYFFALSVSDAEATSLWYQDKLGFRVMKKMMTPDSSALTQILTSGPVTLEIVQQKNSVSKSEFKKLPDFLWRGIFKAGFFVNNLDAVLAHLKVKTVPIFMGPVTDKENKMRFFLIRDNNGNIIQLFELLKE